MATKPQTKKRERVPVGGPRNILTVANQDPNYVYRFVNSSIPGRVERFKLGGYEVVTDDMKVGDTTVDSGSQLGSAVTRSGGGNVVLVLMRIPREWYDEDQAAKQAEIDATEQAMLEDAKKDTYGTLVMPSFGRVK